MTKNRRSMSAVGFLLSAIGSAVGLGNIWGFPTKMFSHGGPVFLIPYLIAILTLGLPIMILELNLGNKWRKTPVTIYSKYIGKSGRLFGWFQTIVQLLIACWYSIIVAWVVISLFSAFGSSFSSYAFFDKTIIGATVDSGARDSLSNFGALGKIQPFVFISFLVIILIGGVILSFGIVKGVERVNKIIVPLLFLIVLFFVFYTAINFSGAGIGLNKLFQPDFTKLANQSAWSGAFAQAFFSLSLVLAVMIVYSARSPVEGDKTNEAMIIVSGDTLIAVLACVIIASTAGYAVNMGIVEFKSDALYWKKAGSSMDGKITSVGLIFQLFPIVFYKLNSDLMHLGSTFAVLFYLALIFAAMSSWFGMLEPSVEALSENRGLNRVNSTILAVLIVFVFGVFFLFQNSDELLWKVAGYTDQMIAFSALIEVAIFAWSYKRVKELIEFNNKTSFFKLRKWYYYVLILDVFLMATVIGFGLYGLITSIKGSTFILVFGAIIYFLPLVCFVLLLTFLPCKLQVKNTEQKMVKTELTKINAEVTK